MQATYNNTSGDSKPLFSGGFATSAAVSDLADGFIGSLVTILDELVEEATQDLRSDAEGDPDWRGYADHLKVDLAEGEISYGYEGDDYVSAVIAGLEYGDLQTSPNPVIRSFANTNKNNFANALTDRIEKELDFG